eukprot:scaffold20626_cov105-Isochrysis_galbana.AAC.3
MAVHDGLRLSRPPPGQHRPGACHAGPRRLSADTTHSPSAHDGGEQQDQHAGGRRPARILQGGQALVVGWEAARVGVAFVARRVADQGGRTHVRSGASTRGVHPLGTLPRRPFGSADRNEQHLPAVRVVQVVAVQQQGTGKRIRLQSDADDLVRGDPRGEQGVMPVARLEVLGPGAVVRRSAVGGRRQLEGVHVHVDRVGVHASQFKLDHRPDGPRRPHGGRRCSSDVPLAVDQPAVASRSEAQGHAVGGPVGAAGRPQVNHVARPARHK